jgi:hypothetical protein
VRNGDEKDDLRKRNPKWKDPHLLPATSAIRTHTEYTETKETNGAMMIMFPHLLLVHHKKKTKQQQRLPPPLFAQQFGL